MLTVRSMLFYVGYATITVVWGSLSVAIAWMFPFRFRFAFIIGCWTRMVLWWLRVTCGVRHEVRGLENIPATPCVVLAKHQSTWETLFLQVLFSPQATVLKKQLLNIPFFGWALRLLRPIAIDRHQRTNALRQLIRIGKARLKDGVWVVLLPEGTRVESGTTGGFYRGGAALAHAAGSPILVVAHNAGRYWPARKFRKRPGTVQVEVSPLIESTGISAGELNSRAEAWLNEAMTRIEGGQMSKLETDSALVSMNTRRGST